jgi:hypothetical protein
VSLDSKRWALMAKELKFHQLDAARQQAEAWRTGLAALTALMTAIFVIKGRDNVSELTQPYRTITVLLLGMALGLLIWATMLVSRAIAGPPGKEILLSGEGLRAWTAQEVENISNAIRWAPRLAVTGIVTVALAVGITWLAPAQSVGGPLIQINEEDGQACGQMIGITQHQVVIQQNGKTVVLPLSTVINAEPVTGCSY